MTFSLVFTLTNGSACSDTIVELLDGVPQAAVIIINAYNYGLYWFVPPIDGWPYS